MLKEISASAAAYSGYMWDTDTHVLQARPELNTKDYGGFEVGLCRVDGALGGRIKVTSETARADQFTPDNIRQIQSLMGISHTSSVIILDRESSEVGHLCIQANDPQWVKSMYRRVKDHCEESLGKTDPQNKNRCNTLEHTLKTAAHEQSAWEKMVETLPVGTGFFLPGAIAGGAMMLGKSLWTHVSSRIPMLMIMPHCGSEHWKEFKTLCPDAGEI